MRSKQDELMMLVVVCRQAAKTAAAATWEFAKSVADVHRCWKLVGVRDVNGRPTYKTWEAFCHRELSISAHYAYQLMDVYVGFTKEQFTKVGASKLAIIVTAPPAARGDLVQLAEAGAFKNKKVLSAVVKQERMAAGYVRPRKDTGTVKAASKVRDVAFQARETPEYDSVYRRALKMTDEDRYKLGKAMFASLVKKSARAAA